MTVVSTLSYTTLSSLGIHQSRSLQACMNYFEYFEKFREKKLFRRENNSTNEVLAKKKNILTEKSDEKNNEKNNEKNSEKKYFERKKLVRRSENTLENMSRSFHFNKIDDLCRSTAGEDPG